MTYVSSAQIIIIPTSFLVSDIGIAIFVSRDELIVDNYGWLGELLLSTDSVHPSSPRFLPIYRFLRWSRDLSQPIKLMDLNNV